MSYNDKTYVIFDGDNDMWAYAYMKGWKSLENVDFDFDDAHDISDIRPGVTEETVKKHLRERFSRSSQVVVLIGEHTKNLYRYVRWEIEAAQELDLPIIGVNLNGEREYDESLCPPILRDRFAVHVSYNKNIIQYALDEFPAWYHANKATSTMTNMHYKKSVYDSLGL
jgi:hypothetical protein